MIGRFQDEYRFLSNFYTLGIPISSRGYECYSVEHGYQIAKFMYMPDYEVFVNEILAGNAVKAKRIGKLAVLPRDWDDKKYAIMEDLVRQKFTANTDLAYLLGRTGDQELVEGNGWNDVFWGVCNGVGENNLGKILMKIRRELLDKQASGRV